MSLPVSKRNNDTQQNAIVESQMDAAQRAELSADHKQRISDVAQEILDEKSDESE